MNSLCFLGSTDITPYINWESYKIQTEDMYESWRDGNYVEHRIQIRTRLTGSFDVWLCGMNNMDTDTFLALVESATDEGIITMTLYDQTKNELKTIRGYVHIVPKSHNEMINGNYFDVYTVEVNER